MIRRIPWANRLTMMRSRVEEYLGIFGCTIGDLDYVLISAAVAAPPQSPTGAHLGFLGHPEDLESTGRVELQLKVIGASEALLTNEIEKTTVIFPSQESPVKSLKQIRSFGTIGSVLI